jgi:hypothetical protein
MKTSIFLLAVLCLPGIISADVVETFESYPIGTPAGSIANAFDVGNFFNATVEARGRNGSNGLCVPEAESPFSNDGRLIWDLMTGPNDIPGEGSTVQLSSDFQIRNSLDLSNTNGSSTVASIGYSGTFNASQSVIVSLFRSGPNWSEFQVVMQEFGIASQSSVVSNARPVSDLGLTANSFGELSDYFTLELDVLHTSNFTGFATANLYDEQGSVLETLSLDLPSFLIDVATGDFPRAEVGYNDSARSTSELCIDNMSHTVIAAVPEPTAIAFLLILGVGASVRRRRL